jgi:hypothetical protein
MHAYVAPEAKGTGFWNGFASGHQADMQMDMFGLGATLMDTVLGIGYVRSSHSADRSAKVLQNKMGVPEDLATLLDALTHYDANDRWTIKQVLCSGWLRQTMEERAVEIGFDFAGCPAPSS